MLRKCHLLSIIWGGDVILQKCFIFFVHFPKVALVDKNNFCTKIFFVALFFKVPRATRTPRPCMKNWHIINFFKCNRVTPCWKDNFKQIQKKKLEARSENAPERLQRSTKVQRFINNTCMTDNSQFCGLLCGEVSVHFLGKWFFSNHIYWLCT